MKASRYTGLWLLLPAFLGAGCAVPYLHPDAVLGISTAELADSRIDQDAFLITVNIPFWQKPNPVADEEDFPADTKTPERGKD